MRAARQDALGILAGALLLALAATPSLGSPPAQPPPPASGFGAPVANATIERGSLENPVAPKHRVFWFRPAPSADAASKDQPASAAKRAPVIVFLHGFGAQGPEPYTAWLVHLAERGAVVLYPTYASLDVSVSATRYDTMWAGVAAALKALDDGPGVRPDPARLGVVGHSFGGGAAPAIAARAWARDFGRDGLFIACFAPWYDLDREAWGHLPRHACLLCVEYQDDQICDPGIGATFPRLAESIPDDRKALRVLRSDAHGSPALVADHMAPLTMRGVDALDARGSWRLVDALAAFAFEGSKDGQTVALGADDTALSLGAWSDGTPITPATTSWDPSSPRASKMRWTCGGVGETAMRRLLATEAFSTLPLPDPKTVVASRMPESELWMRSAPNFPYQRGLLLPASAPSLGDEQRLVASGVPVHRIEKSSDDRFVALSDGESMAALMDASVAGQRSLGAVMPVLWKPIADPRVLEWSYRLSTELAVFSVPSKEREGDLLQAADRVLGRLGIPVTRLESGVLGSTDRRVELRVYAGDYSVARRALEADPALKARVVLAGEELDKPWK